MTKSGKDKDVEKYEKGEKGLEPLLQAHIGRKLREYYDSAVREPVPDRFKNLLDRLESGDEEACVDESGEADRG
jgi:hypothetical protein